MSQSLANGDLKAADSDEAGSNVSRAMSISCRGVTAGIETVEHDLDWSSRIGMTEVDQDNIVTYNFDGFRYRKRLEYPPLIPKHEPDEEVRGRTIADRLAMADNFARENPGDRISRFLRLIFPELSLMEGTEKSALPDRAPAFWARHKRTGETPPEFVVRYYSPWLGKGLARPDIKRLDPQLYGALANWLRNNEMPSNCDLPTLKQQNDRLIKDVGNQGDEARKFDRLAKNIRARSR